MVFDSFEDLIIKLDADMYSIGKDIGMEVGNVLHEESVRMYKVYSGGQAHLRRNGAGGFADKGNIKVGTTAKTGNKYTFSVRNMTKARGRANGAELDKFIEYGIYDVGGAPARPVYSWTKKRLEKEKTVEKAIDKSLREKGWK